MFGGGGLVTMKCIRNVPKSIGIVVTTNCITQLNNLNQLCKTNRVY